MSENWFRYKDEQGREAEIKIPSHDPTAIASFREFMGAIQEGRQQERNNQMQSIAIWKTPTPQLALAQSAPLQLPPAQPVPAASFPKHPEPIYQPTPYDYADLEAYQPCQQAQRQPVDQAPHPAQATTYQQVAAASTLLQEQYQFDPLDDSEMAAIFDLPWWLKLLINPLSLSLSLSLLLGSATWFAIDVLKNSGAPKVAPSPAVQISPSPVAPVSPQPSPAPKDPPQTGNQLQVAPSVPPPPPNL